MADNPPSYEKLYGNEAGSEVHPWGWTRDITTEEKKMLDMLLHRGWSDWDLLEDVISSLPEGNIKRVAETMYALTNGDPRTAFTPFPNGWSKKATFILRDVVFTKRNDCVWDKVVEAIHPKYLQMYGRTLKTGGGTCLGFLNERSRISYKVALAGGSAYDRDCVLDPGRRFDGCEDTRIRVCRLTIKFGEISHLHKLIEKVVDVNWGNSEYRAILFRTWVRRGLWVVSLNYTFTMIELSPSTFQEVCEDGIGYVDDIDISTTARTSFESCVRFYRYIKYCMPSRESKEWKNVDGLFKFAAHPSTRKLGLIDMMLFSARTHPEHPKRRTKAIEKGLKKAKDMLTRARIAKRDEEVLRGIVWGKGAFS